MNSKPCYKSTVPVAKILILYKKNRALYAQFNGYMGWLYVSDLFWFGIYLGRI
tara:strand:+ start:478 stop:636 length:159 start_codon:yes stop_codon:yes gene_type:complete